MERNGTALPFFITDQATVCHVPVTKIKTFFFRFLFVGRLWHRLLMSVFQVANKFLASYETPMV
jgi:hypothetical protein